MQLEKNGLKTKGDKAFVPKVILGDCLKVMAELPDSSVDLIIADPPYNLGKNYGNNSDLKGFDEYLEFSKQWLTLAHSKLKPTGSMYVFMGVRFISYLFDIMDRDLGMSFNSWIVWHYTQGLGKTRGFSPRHDDILFFTKDKDFEFNLDGVRVPQKYYRSRNNMAGANPGDVWGFSHVHYCNENRQNHPTQKPEGLIERMVLASSSESSVVLDPFAGSGTTLRVCQQVKRPSIGIEMNSDYVDQIKTRLNKPFEGFDSIDTRLKRVPRDLNDSKIRAEYLKYHKLKFLKNHENAIPEFLKEVKSMYGHKMTEKEFVELGKL